MLMKYRRVQGKGPPGGREAWLPGHPAGPLCIGENHTVSLPFSAMSELPQQ